MAIEPEELAAGSERVAGQDTLRHQRIDGVIESTELRAMYRLAGEHDFSGAPREIEPGSAQSLLRALYGA